MSIVLLVLAALVNVPLLVLGDEAPVVVLPPLPQMPRDEACGAYRYGVEVPVSIDVARQMRWEPTGAGHWKGTVRVDAPGAVSIGLQFGALPRAGDWEVTVSAPNGGLLYRSRDATLTGPATPPSPASSALITLVADVDPRRVECRLSSYVFGYRSIDGDDQNAPSPPTADSVCDWVDAPCLDGRGWEFLRRATVQVFDRGITCSGVILATTEFDSPVIYTARHCGLSENAVVRFLYEHAACGDRAVESRIYVCGVHIVAEDAVSDGMLLQLRAPIPASAAHVQMGWDIGASAPASGMHMGHPFGLPKKAAFDPDDCPATVVGIEGVGQITAWLAAFSFGGIIKGSSGGGIVDEALRVRGALSGGLVCSPAYFGRLRDFANVPAVRMALDPLGTGVTAIDGYDTTTPPTNLSVASIQPKRVTSGGDAVVLAGPGIDDVTLVRVNDSSVAFKSVQGGVLVQVPASNGETTADLWVQSPGGTWFGKSALSYVDDPRPIVSDTSPLMGSVVGGDEVSLIGEGLGAVTSVEFASVPAEIISQSSRELVVLTPASTSGAGNADVDVLWSGFRTTVGSHLYVADGDIVSHGSGVSTVSALPPNLSGEGPVIPSQSVTLSGILAPAGASAFLILGTALDDVAVGGGVIYVEPGSLMDVIPFDVSAFGTFAIELIVPNALSLGRPVVVQAIYAQDGAVVASSNALVLTAAPPP